ncbi:MAG: O-antigen ligase family protein [Acidimicrobiales bacterium]
MAWLLSRPRPLLLSAYAIIGAALVGAAIALKPIYGLGLFLVLALTVAVTVWPTLGAYVLVTVVPITSGFQKGFPIHNVNLAEALIGEIGILLILVAPRRTELRWRLFDWMLLVFCAGWLIIGLFDALQLHTAMSFSAIDPLIGPFQFLILYRALAVTLRHSAERRMAITCLLFGTIPVDILVYLQQTGSHSVNRLIARMTGGSVFQSFAYSYFARATGPFSLWTPLAGYLLVILLVGFSCLLFRVELPISRRVVGLILLLAVVSLILSAEISALAGAIGGAVLLGIWAGRQKQMLRWLLTALIVGTVFGGSYFAKRLSTEYVTVAGSSRNPLIPQTISYRWQVWTGQYFPAIEQRPLTGWGQYLPPTITWPYTESQYVTMLMEGGFPLLLLFAGEMIALYSQSRRQARRTDLPDSEVPAAVGNAVAAVVVMLVAMDAIYPYMTSGGLPEPLFVAAGIAAASICWGRPSSGSVAATHLASGGESVAAAMDA